MMNNYNNDDGNSEYDSRRQMVPQDQDEDYGGIQPVVSGGGDGFDIGGGNGGEGGDQPRGITALQNYSPSQVAQMDPGVLGGILNITPEQVANIQSWLIVGPGTATLHRALAKFVGSTAAGGIGGAITGYLAGQVGPKSVPRRRF